MLVQFKEDYIIAHAKLCVNEIFGEYNLIYQISTQEELPNTHFCNFPISTISTNRIKWQDAIYEVLYVVQAVLVDTELDDQRISKFKRVTDKNEDTNHLYYKILTFVNNHCVYGYLPIATVREIP